MKLTVFWVLIIDEQAGIINWDNYLDIEKHGKQQFISENRFTYLIDQLLRPSDQHAILGC